MIIIILKIRHYLKDGLAGLTVMVLLTVFSLSARASDLCFQSIRAENSPLSINDIWAIEQDSQGFVWIGTAEGLHRYDGRRFHIYDKTSPGLPSSFIVSLMSDEGGMWIGTDCGVAYYNRALDRIEHFNRKSDIGTSITGKATVITRDRQGAVWFAVNEQGVFRFNPSDGTLVNFFGMAENKLPANVRTIYFYPDGRCLLGLYYMGLYSVDWTKQTLDMLPYFAGDNIVGILPGTSGSVYTLSPSRGLVMIDPDAMPHPIFRPDGDFEPNSISADANYNLWLATLEGAYRYDRLTGDIKLFRNEENNLNSIAENTVRCVFCDNYGGTWIGTAGSGLSYANPTGRNFKKIYLRADSGRKSVMASALSADDDGRIWCATRRAGLYTLSPGGRNVSSVNAAVPSELFSVCAVGDCVWVTSLDGLYCYDRTTGDVRHYERLNPAEPLKEIRLASLYAMHADRLLIATTLGLYSYNPVKDGFDAFEELSKCYITGVASDADGSLWLSTFAHGLIHYDPIERRIIAAFVHTEEPGSLPCNKIMDVAVDSKGNVWVSTFGSGAARMRPDGTFDVFSRNNSSSSFPANVAFQTFEDGLGQIWITTNKGLVALDPITGNSATYTSAQGLLNDDFSGKRGVRTLDGSIYLCSADGVTAFKPLEFKNKARSHAPVITDVYIDGRRIEAGISGSPLGCSPDIASRIDISESDRNIEIYLSDPAFLSADVPAKSYYRLGDDGEWLRMPDDGKLTFPYLPSGDHLLQFREEDTDGSMSELHAPLQLHVAQMFYKTPLAIGLYAILICVGLYLLWDYTDRRNKRNLNRAREELKQRQEIEAYNEKMALFSSVVNRLRAPLALIRNPLENILRTHKDNADLTNDLMVISNGADRLSRLLNDFSDFHADRCSYVLDKRPVRLYEAVEKKIAALSGDSGDAIELNGEPGVCVDGDPSGIDRLIEATLATARAVAGGGVSVSVSSDGHGMVAMEVFCPGLEMSPEIAKTLLYPYLNADDTASELVRSSLPTVKLIAGIHGGSLTFAGPDETAYTFCVLLPESKNAPEEVYESTATDSVLIIEESAGSLADLQKRLECIFRVVTVQSTVVAIDLLMRDRYCAVVAEASSRKPMGISICRHLSAAGAHGSGVPVVVICESGSDHAIGKEALMAGAAMVVEKPCDAAYVEECVRAAVRRAGTGGADSMLLITGDGSVQPVSDEDVRFIKDLERVVAENIADADFDNEQLAAKMCMSKSTLIRRTKKALATTPKDYILKKRLAVAAEMLSKSSGRINEVCYAAGFNTPSYFAKCFRRVYGCLPSEYKGGGTVTPDNPT